MLNNQTPLWQLSLGDFLDLQKKELRLMLESVMKEQAPRKQQDPKQPEEPIDLNEAIRLTGLSKPTIYCKVSRGEMPVLSRRRPLRFSRTDLLQWLHDGRPSNIETALKNYSKRK